MPNAVGVATPNFRTVTRLEGPVVQQLFLVTMEPGSSRERSAHIWLDVESKVFAATETATEAKLRTEIEAMGKDFRIALKG